MGQKWKAQLGWAYKPKGPRSPLAALRFPWIDSFPALRHMASAAILRRSAARSLRLLQPLEQQGCLLARRFVESLSPNPRLLSSSVPTERHKCFPSSDTRSGETMEHKRHVNEKKEDIYQGLSTKIDNISNGLDEQSRLLQELKVQIKENNKHGREINLTPLVVMMPASFLLYALYNYV